MNRIWTVLTFLRERSYKRYLEIGCRDDECFSRVQMSGFGSFKIGVDPVSGGTHRMTSDAFFRLGGIDEKFDLVFIDGDHRHDQVMRDVENALVLLSPGGCIIMHDCLPLDEQHEDPGACGTVWRAFAKLRTRDDLECFCGDYDYGCGIVQRGENSSPVKIAKSMDKMTYQDFEAHRADWMRPIDADAVLALAKPPVKRTRKR